MRRASLISFLLFVFFGSSAHAACRDDQVFLRGDWGQARFTVELARTPDERSQGLMFREHLSGGAGMLFLYDRPQSLAFWMRNTLIELDMLFVDPRGVVRSIHHRAQPHDESLISGGPGLVAVLEINGGLAEALRITPGTQMRHPFFGNDAAWPC